MNNTTETNHEQAIRNSVNSLPKVNQQDDEPVSSTLSPEPPSYLHHNVTSNVVGTRNETHIA